MNRDELKKLLPHREPMLLLDEVTVLDCGRTRGRYAVRGDEYFLQGHFPGNPIVPGVIQCEMAAQACSLLFADDLVGRLPLFTGIREAKFRGVVKPGDELVFECEILRVKKPFYFTKAAGSVNGKPCMSGEFSFALVAKTEGEAESSSQVGAEKTSGDGASGSSADRRL